MISDALKTIGIMIAALGIVLCFADLSPAIIIGSLGWGLLGFSIPFKIDDSSHLRIRRDMAYDLAQIGYCPMGYSGEYDIGKINTRCKGAGFDKCYNCIQHMMGDNPKPRIMSIEEHDALEANDGREQRKDSGMDTVSTDGISDRN